MSSTAIVFVVLIACVTGVMCHYISENAKSKRKAGATTADLDETLAQLDAIEERVRVLERIVTENKFDLKQEIERL